MIQIELDGKQTDLGKVTYAIFALDSKKAKGDHNYRLHIPLSELKNKFKPLYESEVSEMRDSLLEDAELEEDFGEKEWPDYEGLVRNEKLLNKVFLDWYGYAILDLYLEPETAPKWYIVSMDKVEVQEDKITLQGTVTTKDKIKDASPPKEQL